MCGYVDAVGGGHHMAAGWWWVYMWDGRGIYG
jgi:hypothetical protein